MEERSHVIEFAKIILFSLCLSKECAQYLFSSKIELPKW